MENLFSYKKESKFSEEFIDFIKKMDVFFVPKISSQADLHDFVNKLLENGFILSCRNQSNILVGVSMFYANDFESKTSYLSYIAVSKQGSGIGKKLLKMTELVAYDEGMERIILKTNSLNKQAINFYQSNLFNKIEETEDKGRIAFIFEKKLLGVE